MTDDYPVEGLQTPSPKYGPEEVLGIQLDALADNDNPVPDAGIKTAYNFASPANRRSTGPLDRFTRMVRNDRYAPMVDHVEATRGPLNREGDTAEQRVTLTGPDSRTVTYEFGLSVHADGTLADCWLTDRVVVV